MGILKWWFCNQASSTYKNFDKKWSAQWLSLLEIEMLPVILANYCTWIRQIAVFTLLNLERFVSVSSPWVFWGFHSPCVIIISVGKQDLFFKKLISYKCLHAFCHVRGAFCVSKEKMASVQIMHRYWHTELHIWWNHVYTVQHGSVGLCQVKTRVARHRG